MRLIFIHGKPGTGKLTVAKELANLTGFKLFHNHLTVDLVSSIFEFGTPEFIALREKIWLEVFSQAAVNKLEGLIFTFAFEPTVPTDFVEKVKQVVEGNGGRISFVRLHCSPQELEQRLTDPSRAHYGKLNSLELFRSLDEGGAFNDPGLPEDRLTLDTTSLDPSETAAKIAAGI